MIFGVTVLDEVQSSKFVLGMSSYSWAFNVMKGVKVHSSVEDKFFKLEDGQIVDNVISITLNRKKGTVSFGINGCNLGIAYRCHEL